MKSIGVELQQRGEPEGAAAGQEQNAGNAWFTTGLDADSGAVAFQDVSRKWPASASDTGIALGNPDRAA